MNIIVPFKKEVKFDQTLGDIVSISLEHEYNLNNSVLLGNFIISGSFKSHELSANKLDFNYTLPFELTLSEEIDESTLIFSVDNFTYEVLEGDILKVDIDYLVKAKELVRIDENIFEPDNEVMNLLNNDENDPLELLDRELENINEEKISINDIKDNDELIETNNSREVIDEAAILNFAKENSETFVTYKVHIVKEGETIETICTLHGKSESVLNEYNLGVAFNPGDKILIPEDDE